MYACELLLWVWYGGTTTAPLKKEMGRESWEIWKYLTIILRETGHRNYAKEGALLLIQYHFMASERVCKQILTIHFINTKERTGCNLPCDLHLEHLNRRLKGVLTRMESNVKPSSVTRAARAIGVVDDYMCLKDNFQKIFSGLYIFLRISEHRGTINEVLELKKCASITCWNKCCQITYITERNSTLNYW